MKYAIESLVIGMRTERPAPVEKYMPKVDEREAARPPDP